MDRNVMIFGEAEDPHVLALSQFLERSRVSCRIFDFYQIPESSFDIETQFRLLGNQLDSSTPIYWRFKGPRTGSKPPSYLEVDEMLFWRTQWMNFLRTVSLTHPRDKQINPFLPVFSAQHKLLQLKVAQECGLNIPGTLASNSPNDLRKFAKSTEKVIFKSFTPEHPPGGIVFTTDIDGSKIDAANAEIRLAPCLVQEKIEKAYELRVFISTHSQIATRVNASDNELAQTDWRTCMSDPAMFEPFQLPKHVVSPSLEFLRTLDLDFGIFDFIVDKEDKVYFLECNPGGQWLFIEEITEQKITAAIANVIFAKTGH